MTRLVAPPDVPEWKLVHGIADIHVPELTKAFVGAWDEVRSRVSVEDLGASLSRSRQENIPWKVEIGALHGAMVLVCGEIARKTALTLLPRLEDRRSRPQSTPVTQTFADWVDLQFDLRYMEAEQFLNKYLPMLIVNISETTRAAIRDIVLDGFKNGKHPYQMAEEIKALIGMTPGQVRAYRAFAANLAKNKIAASRQAEALDAYRQRAINQRAKNIARTETLRASNAGQMTLWGQAEANGLLGSGAKRVWIATPGSPRTCPFCNDLDGKTATMSGLWTGGVQQPPAHPSCRCAMGLEFE